ncbi:MAG TPA: hypothetical protein VFW93_17515 [Aquabacterium sp.]|uniref:hypothetical protein n=1 Tax=Aquabacterium sp. TaxID=1872578 RepID=UPI002E3811D8|nr:hypothetical protein [Aquabacterium sp.]HEX5358005.1 hypothetical protein [Aquabacterium sp.]
MRSILPSLTKTLLIALLAANGAATWASQNAVTDNGSVVLLNDDGTWRYISNEGEKSGAQISFNKGLFQKSANQTFQLKSAKNRSATWLDPRKWLFQKPDTGASPAEYRFQLKAGDLYGMMITEQIEVELDRLPQLAFEMLRRTAPNARVVSQEFRVVNDYKVVRMRMDANVQGINLSYIGYYTSDKSGSTQYVTYTATNLVEKNLPEIEEFLNGLTRQK